MLLSVSVGASVPRRSLRVLSSNSMQGVHLCTRSTSSCLMSPCCSCCWARPFCSCCCSCCMSLCCSSAWFFSFVTSVFSFLLRSCRQTFTMCGCYGIEGWMVWDAWELNPTTASFWHQFVTPSLHKTDVHHWQRTSPAAQHSCFATGCHCSCMAEPATYHMLC